MKKWMGEAVKKPGALHEDLGIPQGQKIPTSRLQSEVAALSKKAKGAKKLSAAELTKLHRLQFALRARNK